MNLYLGGMITPVLSCVILFKSMAIIVECIFVEGFKNINELCGWWKRLHVSKYERRFWFVFNQRKVLRYIWIVLIILCKSDVHCHGIVNGLFDSFDDRIPLSTRIFPSVVKIAGKSCDSNWSELVVASMQCGLRVARFIVHFNCRFQVIYIEQGKQNIFVPMNMLLSTI